MLDVLTLGLGHIRLQCQVQVLSRLKTLRNTSGVDPLPLSFHRAHIHSPMHNVEVNSMNFPIKLSVKLWLVSSEIFLGVHDRIADEGNTG